MAPGLGGLTLEAGIAAAQALDQQGADEIAFNATEQIQQSNVRMINNATVATATEGANYTQTETKMNALQNELSQAVSGAVGQIVVKV